MSDHLRFRLLASGKVQQAHPDGSTATFDPADWAEYRHGEKTVRACRIPREFQVAGDVCRDGWLVRDDRGLMAVSSRTFATEYDLTLLNGGPLAAAVD